MKYGDGRTMGRDGQGNREGRVEAAERHLRRSRTAAHGYGHSRDESINLQQAQPRRVHCGIHAGDDEGYKCFASAS